MEISHTITQVVRDVLRGFAILRDHYHCTTGGGRHIGDAKVEGGVVDCRADDDFDIAATGVTVDGFVVLGATAADDVEVDDELDILSVMDIPQLTGTTFVFELDDGGTPITAADGLAVTITYIARDDQVPAVSIK